MRYYFHADTKKYNKRLRHMIIVVIMPILAACTFCTVNIVLNYRSPLAMLLFTVIACSVLFGMTFTFAAVYFTEKRKRRHARYTFFDFVPSGMVFSEYAGEFTRYGEKIVLRRLYYIPFDKLESVSRDPKTSPHNITFKGEIRGYFLESGRLGYHVGEDGKLDFDSAELNWRLFENVSELTVKNRFGNTKDLEKSALFYREQFINTPEKKPFDISEYISARKNKRKPRTSNPALDAPSYNRDWK